MKFSVIEKYFSARFLSVILLQRQKHRFYLRCYCWIAWFFNVNNAPWLKSVMRNWQNNVKQEIKFFIGFRNNQFFLILLNIFFFESKNISVAWLQVGCSLQSFTLPFYQSWGTLFYKYKSLYNKTIAGGQDDRLLRHRRGEEMCIRCTFKNRPEKNPKWLSILVIFIDNRRTYYSFF